ncbi:MAG: hypothetical protein V4517_15750 [Pseudomonadota bacterium]
MGNAVPSSDEFTVNLPRMPGTKRRLPTILETRLGFAVAWIEHLPGVHLQIFDANGPAGAEQTTTLNVTDIAWPRSMPAASPSRIWPTLVPLPGGRFLLAWTQVNVDNAAAGTNVVARIFQVNTLTGGTRFSLGAAATSGPAGDIAFLAWRDDNQASADKSGRALKGRPLPIPAAGF